MNELLKVMFTVLGKVLDKFPNYDQQKKEEYHQMREDYINERLKSSHMRDDNKIIILEIKLKNFIADFSTYLGSNNEKNN